MSSNKKLPILKLFLAPVILGTAYGAYCYYSSQYYNQTHKQHAPIRYMQQLYHILNQSNSLVDVKRVYLLICKHYDKFIIDPSTRDEKVTNSDVGKEI